MTSGWIFWVAGDTKLLYLLNCRFLFCLSNVLFPFCRYQLGGSFLLGVGVWVLVDPTGFREIVATNPLLFTGVYIILGMGGMLFLLGFLGCCGAIRENKCLLLFVSWLTKSKHSCVTARVCVRVCVDYSLCQSWNRKPKEQNAFVCCLCAEWSEHHQNVIFHFPFLSFSFLNTWTCTFFCLHSHLPCHTLSHPFLFPFVLLQFFMLILLIFLAELAAAILAFIFREHVSFLKSSPHLWSPLIEVCSWAECQNARAQILTFCTSGPGSC